MFLSAMDTFSTLPSTFDKKSTLSSSRDAYDDVDPFLPSSGYSSGIKSPSKAAYPGMYATQNYGLFSSSTAARPPSPFLSSGTSSKSGYSSAASSPLLPTFNAPSASSKYGLPPLPPLSMPYSSSSLSSPFDTPTSSTGYPSASSAGRRGRRTRTSSNASNSGYPSLSTNPYEYGQLPSLSTGYHGGNSGSASYGLGSDGYGRQLPPLDMYSKAPYYGASSAGYTATSARRGSVSQMGDDFDYRYSSSKTYSPAGYTPYR